MGGVVSEAVRCDAVAPVGKSGERRGMTRQGGAVTVFSLGDLLVGD